MPSFVLRDCISCRDSRAKCDAVLFHELENFRCAFVAVLDSFDTSQHSATHAFGRGGVRGNWPPGRTSRLHDEIQFFLRKSRARRLVLAPPIIGIHFYPVGAFADLLASGAHRFLWTAHFLRTLRQVEIGRKLWAVAARRH